MGRLGAMGGVLTLDQTLHGLRGTLSGRFSSGNHDYQTDGKHAQWKSHLWLAHAACARSGTRAGETRNTQQGRFGQVHEWDLV